MTLTFACQPYSEIAREGELEFRMLAVDPPARGRGVGATLVAAVIERACELGASRVVLSSQARMRAAHRVYQRFGFVRLPERDWAPDDQISLQAYSLEIC